ncbi:MAG: hypothetical protein ACRC3Y_16235 [Romboutsia sp.]|uniref:hypothetical protein n=1 Tax=Romboutsia sp. TaxID=1965302 RepID=UPI003F39F58C
MKKGDFIWGGVLILWIAILAVPSTREVFITTTEAYPYIGGFFKFAILATMGELLGIRIMNGDWKKPNGIIFRAIVWGIIGILMTLSLSVFPAGITKAQEIGKLPFEGSIFAHALFTSAVMNILQSPAVFLFHKCTDTYIDEKHRRKGGSVTLKDVVNKIDWYTYLNFTVLKTIPFFWIPCHTIVFLFPSEFRVIASAFASIALGLILALANKSKTKVNI